jgi:hypothetical protein
MQVNTKESQLDRFKKAAQASGADEADDALDRIMGKLDLKKKPEPSVSEELQDPSSDEDGNGKAE